MRGTLLERTVAKITVGHPMECWPFTGAVTGGPRGGYGVLARGRRGEGQALAHVVIFEAVFGPLPDGHEVDHLCETKVCANPWHLDAVPHGTNMRRWMATSTRVGSTWRR